MHYSILRSGRFYLIVFWGMTAHRPKSCIRQRRGRSMAVQPLDGVNRSIVAKGWRLHVLGRWRSCLICPAGKRFCVAAFGPSGFIMVVEDSAPEWVEVASESPRYQKHSAPPLQQELRGLPEAGTPIPLRWPTALRWPNRSPFRLPSQLPPRLPSLPSLLYI